MYMSKQGKANGGIHVCTLYMFLVEANVLVYVNMYMCIAEGVFPCLQYTHIGTCT